VVREQRCRSKFGGVSVCVLLFGAVEVLHVRLVGELFLTRMMVIAIDFHNEAA
jgi:hypothetical protein